MIWAPLPLASRTSRSAVRMFSVRSQPQAIWVAATTTFISRPLLLGQHQGIGRGPGCPDLVTNGHWPARGARFVGDIGGDDDAAAILDEDMALIAVIGNLLDPTMDLEPAIHRLPSIQPDLFRPYGKADLVVSGTGKRHRHAA